jgi:hypothetical protein
LLAAATAGAAPAGPANKRKAIRIVLDPDDRPVAKGKLCAQDHGFNLHAATKVAPWAELLRKTFGFEIVCSKCHSQLRLIALIKTEAVAKTILKAMHLPTEIPELHPARPRPPPAADTGGGDDWLN